MVDSFDSGVSSVGCNFVTSSSKDVSVEFALKRSTLRSERDNTISQSASCYFGDRDHYTQSMSTNYIKPVKQVFLFWVSGLKGCGLKQCHDFVAINSTRGFGFAREVRVARKQRDKA